ncbi:hypothetical protein QO002_002134 [Pararhizobium capsulatum DSM 1112]|uniref:Uncharacterized protein n=1 Tax=Pararhizobium capsulatum DSM 1112 TaxID=1121113 RepID=A0ABU0BP17_9HYPH|nr:hypothetical protein [Pararhizobium capsulatum]MDQ0319996.1 hypothetical protein [Pararhizobium capsulatum DSM 1112]
MIGNIIAYTIVGAFGLPGALGLVATVVAARKEKYDDSVKLFWPSIIMLAIALVFAWMWGI